MDRGQQDASQQPPVFDFEVKEQDRWLPIANGEFVPGCLVLFCFVLFFLRAILFSVFDRCRVLLYLCDDSGNSRFWHYCPVWHAALLVCVSIFVFPPSPYFRPLPGHLCWVAGISGGDAAQAHGISCLAYHIVPLLPRIPPDELLRPVPTDHQSLPEPDSLNDACWSLRRRSGVSPRGITCSAARY
jgi:hypothetical protein